MSTVSGQPRVVVVTGASDGIGAAAADWQSGGYFADRKPATVNPAADDPDLAARLRDQSARMCGLQPPAPAPQPPAER
jgi:NAD(P)-dependent dehydrogenase (short-subunit alcohol dehydrogenase family)